MSPKAAKPSSTIVCSVALMMSCLRVKEEGVEGAARLEAFDAEASALEDVLQALELPTLETLKTPKREDG